MEMTFFHCKNCQFLTTPIATSEHYWLTMCVLLQGLVSAVCSAV